MNRAFYFFFSCAVSYMIICNANFAAETSQGSSAEEKQPRKNNSSPKKASQPKLEPYPSLKEYLKGAENTPIDVTNEADHARRATELTLVDEGMLPQTDTGIYKE
jgi:hypothetical protein